MRLYARVRTYVHEWVCACVSSCDWFEPIHVGSLFARVQIVFHLITKQHTRGISISYVYPRVAKLSNCLLLSTNSWSVSFLVERVSFICTTRFRLINVSHFFLGRNFYKISQQRSHTIYIDTFRIQWSEKKFVHREYQNLSIFFGGSLHIPHPCLSFFLLQYNVCDICRVLWQSW